MVTLANDIGKVTTKYAYDPYGNEIGASGTEDSNPFRYSGEYTDFESGYQYLRARYYDPSIGRFISEDAALDGDNWYVYCAGDPVNRIDPYGNSWEDVYYAPGRFILGLWDEMPEWSKDIVRGGTDVIMGLANSIDQNFCFGVGNWVRDGFGIEEYEPLHSDVDIYNAAYLTGTWYSYAASAYMMYTGIVSLGNMAYNGISLMQTTAGTVELVFNATAFAGVGTATATLLGGGCSIVNNFKSDSRDSYKTLDTGNQRNLNTSKQESNIWKKFDKAKGKDRRTSGKGNSKKFYEWDHTHNDIEVYNNKGKHLGSMDPITGEMYKPAVKGRTIKL